MLKTFLRRWYLARNIYYMTDKFPGNSIRHDHFIEGVLKKRSSWVLFLSSKMDTDRRREIEKFLNEFKKENVFELSEAYIGSENKHVKMLKLGPRGGRSILFLIFYSMMLQMFEQHY